MCVLRSASANCQCIAKPLNKYSQSFFGSSTNSDLSTEKEINALKFLHSVKASESCINFGSKTAAKKILLSRVVCLSRDVLTLEKFVGTQTKLLVYCHSKYLITFYQFQVGPQNKVMFLLEEKTSQLNDK